jgi:hypothetical protein
MTYACNHFLWVFHAVEYAKDLQRAHTATAREGGAAGDEKRGGLGTPPAMQLYDCGGVLRNLDRVLGARRWLWLLPVDAPGLACVLSPSAETKLAP